MNAGDWKGTHNRVLTYSQLLRWRMVVQTLGEDLPVCAYLAWRTETLRDAWDDFEWNTVISHDNMQLTRILEKGCADNHFHLFASAPAFHLTWLKLMNQPADRRCLTAVKEIDRERRVGGTAYMEDDLDDPMDELVYKAALIRVVLVWFLHCASVGNPRDLKKLDNEIDKVEYDLNYSGKRNIKRQELQQKINALRLAAGSANPDNEVDYALIGTNGHSMNHDFEGERRLLYYMLLGNIGSFSVSPIMKKWFYAYLVIKGKFYREFVQVNDMTGFANFSIYNKRKDGFLYSLNDWKRMVCHAVLDTFEDKAVSYLEMRISPLNSVKEYRNTILSYDGFIEGKEKKHELLDKCCYVVHFPKKSDELLKSKKYGIYDMLPSCRHRKYRDKIHAQANALIMFRLHAQAQAVRICGIDACSQEIGCRPEVFGPVFRMLSEHVVPGRNIYGVKQLKITYHVGEDFLDLADGLRAIDEALLFLNMKRGDRLGHATALGLDVQDWYQSKNRVINLPLHDYLDNVVWMYHKLIEYNIKDCENLKEYLVIEYGRVFGQIYEECLEDSFVDDIADEISRSITGISDSGDKVKGHYSFDINVFYEAWKLRGDDPACYHENRFIGTATKRMRYKERINWSIKGGAEIRKNAKAVALYLMYHYSAGVRQKGSQMCRLELPQIYVDGVARIQKKLQWIVAEKGIGIETNPSSNYQISTIKRYQDHPISNLYNMGLATDADELKNCPQLNVSINTDDKGVFHTSLANEFALMGCAMEHVKGNDGLYKYQGQMIYEWLDKIREMGMEQRFDRGD